MIRYTLNCDQGHDFESWFASAGAFGVLHSAGHLACPMCGSGKVEKSLMAPAVRPARTAACAAPAPAAPGALSQPKGEVELALAEMRRQIEENSDYVGVNFVTEARRMHEGDTPERSIWGEARPKDVKALIEDGVPIAPLPFMHPRRSN